METRCTRMSRRPRLRCWPSSQSLCLDRTQPLTETSYQRTQFYRLGAHVPSTQLHLAIAARRVPPPEVEGMAATRHEKLAAKFLPQFNLSRDSIDVGAVICFRPL